MKYLAALKITYFVCPKKNKVYLLKRDLKLPRRFFEEFKYP